VQVFVTLLTQELHAILMKYKSKINDLNLNPDTVKELELDEQPQPTKKLERPAVPNVDSARDHSHRKIKGTRKAK
jgi:hypothetical protein